MNGDNVAPRETLTKLAAQLMNIACQLLDEADREEVTEPHGHSRDRTTNVDEQAWEAGWQPYRPKRAGGGPA